MDPDVLQFREKTVEISRELSLFPLEIYFQLLGMWRSDRRVC